jgi:hypothetical protein
MMAYQLERSEPGVIFANFEGVVTKEEVIRFTHERIQLADAHQEQHYVGIMDVSRSQSLPFDVQMTSWAMKADPRLIQLIVVGNRTLLLKILANIIATLLQFNAEFVDTREVALERARALLAEKAP